MCVNRDRREVVGVLIALFSAKNTIGVPADPAFAGVYAVIQVDALDRSIEYSTMQQTNLVSALAFARAVSMLHGVKELTAAAAHDAVPFGSAQCVAV